MATLTKDDGELLLWESAQPEAAVRFAAHIRGGSCAAFRPDGKLLATGAAEDCTAKVWELAGLLRRPPDQAGAFQPVAHEQAAPLPPSRERASYAPGDVDSIFTSVKSEVGKFARKHKQEAFYAFAFDACLLRRNSVERFAATLRKYQEDRGDDYRKLAQIKALRSNTGDWHYQGFTELPIAPDVYWEDHYGKSVKRHRTSAYRTMIDKLVRRLRAASKEVFADLRTTPDFKILYAEHTY